MTIQQIIKDLEELSDTYLIQSENMKLSASTRAYYYGKHLGVNRAIGY